MTYLLQQLLDQSASRFPEAPAVSCRGRSLSYRELQIRSTQLARLLAESGVERGDRVGICLPKSLEAVISIYGVLKAGGVYVPLDYGSPGRRLAWMIQDCRMRTVVTTESRARTLFSQHPASPFLQTLIMAPEGQDREASTHYDLPVAVRVWQELDRAPERSYRPPHQTEQDLCYILYTSGSTGTPKGVMISHRAALTFVDWAAREIALGPRDRVSNHAPFHFDLSVFDLFASARAGAHVVLVPEELSSFPRELGLFWEQEQLTVWYSVPSVVSRMVMHGGLESRNLSCLRAVLFAGEVFPVDHLRRFAELAPHVELVNLYGPTETNVCTFHRVADPLQIESSVPIGRACPNVDVWAVKDNGELAGPGEIGELWVAGPLLMNGYWGEPEKTRAAFAQVPAPGEWGRIRAYRTGDLVRIGPGGEFIFVGRQDSMVKIRGYRVEPGEIEAALFEYPDVLEAAVLPVMEGTSEASLIAILIAVQGKQVEADEVRRWLKDRLPAYMIPSRIEILSRLPRTTTGKVDKRKLREQVLEQ